MNRHTEADAASMVVTRRNTVLRLVPLRDIRTAYLAFRSRLGLHAKVISK